MQSVAQSWLVYRLTGSEWLLGVTSFCSNFPVFVLGPVAGVVADRFDRRKVVLTTQALFMLDRREIDRPETRHQVHDLGGTRSGLSAGSR
jgi:MFS family permease